MPQAVIVSATRTPIGSFQGSLSQLRATTLGAVVLSNALKLANIEPSEVDEVIMGCVLSAGIGQNPARQASIEAEIPNSIPAFTVNKVCSSGLLSVMLADQAIRLGEKNIMCAGGMESMSNAPYILPKARNGYRLGDGKIVDSLVHDGLWDHFNDKHMGIFAEATAKKYNLTRELQDEFAITSYKRALEATKNGSFKDEISTVEIPQKKGDPIIFNTDEEPARINFEKLQKLKPAFDKNGTVTAANSSSISDGAAALLLMSNTEAKKRNIVPLAKIVATATHSHEPEWFTTAPTEAIKKVLNKTGWKKDNVDLFEINEAFSAVTLAAISELKLDSNKVNIHGGAVALGHPIGCSGARIIVTLLHAMKQKNAKKGIATLCNGGGEATAIAVEI